MDNLLRPKKVMVLGAASWLGYVLIGQLERQPEYEVIGSLHVQRPRLPETVTCFQATKSIEYADALKRFQPEVVVNFLRGEDDEGVAIHQAVIAYCSHSGAHYVYASSALALDGYTNRTLSENLTGLSTSEYGRFKAESEASLLNRGFDWSVIRFSSVHGWVPHKVTRTESFLRKMQAGEMVRVDRGIVQNRMLADLLMEGVVEIIRKAATGVFHFGATTSSEEYVFLQKLAAAFGYPSGRIISGSELERNIVLMPGDNVKSLGERFSQTEEEAVSYLRQLDSLSKYYNH